MCHPWVMLVDQQVRNFARVGDQLHHRMSHGLLVCKSPNQTQQLSARDASLCLEPTSRH